MALPVDQEHIYLMLVLTPVRRLRRRAFPITRGNAPSKTAAPLSPIVVPVAVLGDPNPKDAGLKNSPFSASVSGKVANAGAT